MPNATSGPAAKGSRFWIQHFVNSSDVTRLHDAIRAADPGIGRIAWLSPLAAQNYAEWTADAIPGIKPEDIAFWPRQGPWWDAVGAFGDNGILLVEAKAHPRETESACGAISAASIGQIDAALEATHAALTGGAPFTLQRRHDWTRVHYQLANRLAFLHHLRAQGKAVRLVLVNFACDHTHIPTAPSMWREHSELVWTRMTGRQTAPEGVLEVYIQVPDR